MDWSAGNKSESDAGGTIRWRARNIRVVRSKGSPVDRQDCVRQHRNAGSARNDLAQQFERVFVHDTAGNHVASPTSTAANLRTVRLETHPYCVDNVTRLHSLVRAISDHNHLRDRIPKTLWAGATRLSSWK